VQVEELLRLLPNLFPVRSESSSGVHKVFPYHKSVLDWLQDARNGWGVDVGLGHTIIGNACFGSVTSAAALATTEACKRNGRTGQGIVVSSSSSSSGRGSGGGSGSSGGDVLLSYALRYGVAHSCTAKLTTRLEELVLDFACFWPSVYAAGKSRLKHCYMQERCNLGLQSKTGDEL